MIIISLVINVNHGWSWMTAIPQEETEPQCSTYVVSNLNIPHNHRKVNCYWGYIKWSWHPTVDAHTKTCGCCTIDNRVWLHTGTMHAADYACACAIDEVINFKGWEVYARTVWAVHPTMGYQPLPLSCEGAGTPDYPRCTFVLLAGWQRLSGLEPYLTVTLFYGRAY